MAGPATTLADDAPTRFHRGNRCGSCRCASSMHCFEAALPVVKDCCASIQRSRRAHAQGPGLPPAASTTRKFTCCAAEDFKDDTEASGILGRLQGSMAPEWKDGATPQEWRRLRSRPPTTSRVRSPSTTGRAPQVRLLHRHQRRLVCEAARAPEDGHRRGAS